MTNYPELVVFLLLLPVVIQIIIPLLMLVGFSLGYAVRTVFGWKRSVGGVKSNSPHQEKNVEQPLLHPWQTAS
jgi:hypothetical protein